MHLLDRASTLVRARPKPARGAAHAQREVPPPGSYLTDGAALFRVGQTLPGRLDGAPLLELEDCGTLEIVLCSLRTVQRADVRAVTPAFTV